MQIHRHFKGKYYLTLFKLTNGDTQETCIAYYPLYGCLNKPRLFVRTVTNFYEYVNKPKYNYCGPRFKRVNLIHYLKHLIQCTK